MIETLQNFGRKFIYLLKADYKKPLSKEDVFGNSHPFVDVLPYEAFDEESSLFVNQTSFGFTIESLPIIGADETTQKEITSIFQELLEEGDSVQCLLWADHRTGDFLNAWEKSRNQAPDIYKEIAKKRTESLKNNPNLSPKIFRFIFSYSSPIKKGSETFQMSHLSEKKDKILKALKTITYSFCWDVDDFLNSVNGMINFSTNVDPVRKKWNPYEMLSNQFGSGGSLKVREEGLEWNHESKVDFKSFRVTDFPDFWSLSAMQNLIGDVFRESYRIKDPFYLHYAIHCPKESKVEQEFWKRSQLIEKQGMSHNLRRMIPDLEKELNECDLVRKNQNDGIKFVKTLFSAGIWAPKGKMSQAEHAFKTLFRINGFTLVENNYLHLPLFLSALPMTLSEYVEDFERSKLFKTTMTTECGNLIPIQGEWMGTSSAGMLMVGRRGQLVNWNPFDNKSGNYNVVVVGKSGAGKSVYMQDLLLSGLGIGAKVFIIDVGRSFEKMCDSLDGQHIEFSNRSNICLNPFSNISEKDEDERSVSFSYLKNIIACMASPVEGTTSYENATIEEAIRFAWDKKKTQATITDVSDWLKIQEDTRAKSLGVMLNPYTKRGVYAKYFEGKNNVSFTNPIVLIELEELKEKKDLQAVVLQLFIMAITNHAFLGDRKTPFYICIDEAWDLLRGKQTGIFIETLARRLRKYYGALVTGTQSLEDFFASPGALAAFENSDWLCLLSQKPSSIRRLAESNKIEMTPHKQKALESVASVQGLYSEVAICDADGNYSICRLYLDRFSQLLYSTQAKEYAEIAELKKQGLTIVEAINRIIENQKYLPVKGKPK